MKRCKKCTVEKSIDSFSKASGCKDGTRHTCKVCESARKKEWAEENRDRILKKKKEYYRENIEHFSEYNRVRRSTLEYKEYFKEYYADWKKNKGGQEIRNAHSAKRKALSLNAELTSPSRQEFNSFCIGEFYALSKERSKVTGIEWHVDHIVPLINSLVCGLHSPQNLRVIPALQNLQKNNTFIV